VLALFIGPHKPMTLRSPITTLSSLSQPHQAIMRLSQLLNPTEPTIPHLICHLFLCPPQFGDDTRSQGGRSSTGRSAAARTARASEWGHTAIFGDEDDEMDDAGGRFQGGPRSVAGRSHGGARSGGSRLLSGGPDGEPIDLLDTSTARQLVRAAAGGGPGGSAGRARASGGGTAAFEMDADGRMVIDDPEEEERAKAAAKRAKRKRGGEEFLIDSEDSDYDDLRGYAPGIERALMGAKSVRFAPSVAGGKSLGGKSRGGRSAGGVSTKSGRGAAHSGDRFKPKKGGTGGDSKGSNGVEPYAYWQLDRRMLNRRRGKQAGASKQLGSLVKAAQAGAAKGAKAKRQAAAKRHKR
jgi:ribosomal RNA-processing protein 12